MRPIDDLREKIDLWKKSTADTALMSVLHDVLKQIDVVIHEMDHQEAESPWRRVEEELPYENTNALFYDENGYFHVGSMSRFRGYTEFIDYDGNTLHGVTHWMPIEPPKEDA